MGQLIGDIIGSGNQNSEDSQATQAQQQALANILGMQAPSVQEQELNPENETSAGTLTPEQETALKQQNTDLNNVSVSPQLRAAQMQALQSLQQQGQTGLTASDRQALQQIEQQNAQQENSANQAVLQGAAQRGMGGSGASLAAQLANNQNAANNAQNRSMSVASQAQQNALNATAQSGQLGSQIEGQQYGEAANAARAQDAINQFNTANAQNVGNTNVQAGNQAQAYNLQNAQNIGNYNTQAQNQAQQYNSQLYQQQYNDQLQQQEAAAGETNNLAANEMKAGQNQYNQANQIGQQGGQAAAQVATLFSQGGMVKGYADGGMVNNFGAPSQTPSTPTPSGFSGTQQGQALINLLGGTSGSSNHQQSQQQGQPQDQTVSSLIKMFQGMGGGNSNVTMPDGSVANAGNNFGASQLTMPDMSASTGAAAGSAPSLNLGSLASSGAAAGALSQGGMVRNYANGGIVAPSAFRPSAIKPINFKASQEHMVAQKPIRLFNEAGASANNYAQGGTVQQNLEAIQNGANTTTDARKPAPVPFDPSKYAAPKSMDDAEEDAQNQAQLAQIAQQLAKFKAANNMPTDNLLTNPNNAQNYMGGGKVKGKEVVRGDSPKNDTVRANLSAGEIVLPKSIVESSDEAVLAFIKAAKGGK